MLFEVIRVSVKKGEGQHHARARKTGSCRKQSREMDPYAHTQFRNEEGHDETAESLAENESSDERIRASQV